AVWIQENTGRGALFRDFELYRLSELVVDKKFDAIIPRLPSPFRPRKRERSTRACRGRRRFHFIDLIIGRNVRHVSSNKNGANHRLLAEASAMPARVNCRRVLFELR